MDTSTTKSESGEPEGPSPPPSGSGGAAASAAPFPPRSTQARACDACRARKARCDRKSPCSNCKLHNNECLFSALPRPAREKLSTGSSRFDDKLDALTSRMNNIERLLQDLISQNSSQIQRQQQQQQQQQQQLLPPSTTHLPLSHHRVSPQSAQTAQTHVQSPHSDAVSSVSAQATLIAHSQHAKSIFEMLYSRSVLTQSPKTSIALSQLQTVIGSQSDYGSLHDLRFSPARNVTEFSLGAFRLPPVDAVQEALRFASKNIPRICLKLPLLETPVLLAMCQTVYSQEQETMVASFSVVNGMLYYIFNEQAVARCGETHTAPFATYASLCRMNFESTLEDFNLSTNPSLEACQAMTLGAFHATELVKPYLTRLLITSVAQMCHRLSYHRIHKPSPSTRPQSLVFWAAFAIENSLALRLGYVPILNDADILTPRPTYPDDPALHAWHDLFLSWVELSRFQARAFAELYTPESLSLPQDLRSDKAARLAADVQSWHDEWVSLQHHTLILYIQLFQAALEATEVVYHTLLAVTFRIIPPAPTSLPSQIFSPACVASARQALDLHQLVAARYKGSNDIWRGYVNWALLSSPIAPFLILFCEAVTTASQRDLHALLAFTATIEPMSSSTEIATRLYQLCAAFANVASVYLEQPGPADWTPGGHQHQVGYAPMVTGGLSGNVPATMAPPHGLDATEYWPAEDWFSQDFSMIGGMQ